MFLTSVQTSPGEEIAHGLLHQHNIGDAWFRNRAPDLLQAQIANLNLVGDQSIVHSLEPPNQLVRTFALVGDIQHLADVC